VRTPPLSRKLYLEINDKSPPPLKLFRQRGFYSLIQLQWFSHPRHSAREGVRAQFLRRFLERTSGLLEREVDVLLMETDRDLLLPLETGAFFPLPAFFGGGDLDELELEEPERRLYLFCAGGGDTERAFLVRAGAGDRE